MKRFTFTAFALAALSTAACSGTTAEAQNAEASEDSIVGITNLAEIEGALGLEAGAGDVAKLHGGECYKTFIDDGNPDTWTMNEYEFRRYKNGAAFFAKKGSGYNSGDFRPVVCVDFVATNGSTASLSGAALDAAIRYNLGKIKSRTGDLKYAVIDFERGSMKFLQGQPLDEQRKAIQKRPGELPVDEVITAQGRLENVQIRGLLTDVMFAGPEVHDHDLPGVAANVAFRFAWRKAEDTGVFTIAQDSLGKLRSSAGGEANAAAFGDGPGWGHDVRMSNGTLSHGGYGDEIEGVVIHEISIRRPGGFVPPSQDSRPPLAECSQKMGWNEQTQQEYPLGPWVCTGI